MRLYSGFMCLFGENFNPKDNSLGLGLNAAQVSLYGISPSTRSTLIKLNASTVHLRVADLLSAIALQ
jgi:hypothetical protein